MDIVFKNTKEDFKNFYREFYQDYLRKWRIFFVLISMCAGMALSQDNYTWWKPVLFIPASALVLYFLFYLIPYFEALRKLNRTFTGNFFNERRKIYTSGDGLAYYNASGDFSLIKWETIHSFIVNKNYINIIKADNTFLLIPIRAFQSNDDQRSFIRMLETATGKKPGFQTSKSPSYYLGLICLIPLVGGVVGIGLALSGIFIYRNKWLVLIGVAGILFTVGVYYFLFFSPEAQEKIEKDLMPFSITQMNDYVQAIEFYKIQHGVYPDSLMEISKNVSSNMQDPIQQFNWEVENKKYNYQKRGNKYTLFSSGLDGKPNTSDDLYPTITNGDTVKFGLVIIKH